MPRADPCLCAMLLSGRYRLVDLATQSYLVLVAGIIGLLRGEHWITLVLLHLAAVAGIHALTTFEENTEHSRSELPAAWWRRGLGWLREIYPVLLYPAIYVEIETVNRMLAAPRIDPWLLRADHALFGFQPAEVFPVALPHPLFSEFMHASYLSFYAMVGGIALWLAASNRPACRHFVAVVSLMFYACYAIFLFVPAWGPRVLSADTPERAWFAAQYGRSPRPVPEAATRLPVHLTLAFVERHGEIPAAAFPSSHVAVALGTTWLSWRHLRRLRWLHLCFTLTILFSTVYTRAHYAVDVLGGLVAAAVLLPAAQALYAATDGRRQTPRS
jgi:membrane-associated phospholipid phosphatase